MCMSLSLHPSSSLNMLTVRMSINNSVNKSNGEDECVCGGVWGAGRAKMC